MPLSDLFLRHAVYKGRSSGDKYPDLYGMYLLVTRTGKYWRMNYRHAGKQKTLALGVYPRVSLGQARRKAEDARRRLSSAAPPRIPSTNWHASGCSPSSATAAPARKRKSATGSKATSSPTLARCRSNHPPARRAARGAARRDRFGAPHQAAVRPGAAFRRGDGSRRARRHGGPERRIDAGAENALPGTDGTRRSWRRSWSRWRSEEQAAHANAQAIDGSSWPR